ncbi:MAG: HD domain-containing protein [Rickettsiales bacterium]|jgi:5'-deoxynucleotidase YfbR-like HD superfamily hydrolase|nr:HD domain-containing protein [Rickettsiales bacterium]
MDAAIPKIFDFIKAVNALKFEMRYGDDAPDMAGRRDSVAAHSWRMCLLVQLLGDALKDELRIDVPKAVRLALVHDIPEAVVGDVSFDKVYYGGASLCGKKESEQRGMREICAFLPEPVSGEVYSLWEEYEAAQTDEARFVKICDKLEAAYQSMFIGLGDGRKGLLPEASILHSNKGYGWFPAMDEAIRFVRGEFKRHCEENGVEWKDEYELTP